MPQMRNFLRTRLAISAEKALELAKIQKLYDEKSRRLVIQIGDERFNIASCSNVDIDLSQTVDSIQFTRPTAVATPAVAASKIIQDLTYTANTAGTAGNSITITYVDPAANNQLLSVSVVGSAITVHLATGAGGAITSTATLIKAAVDASAPAHALVAVAISGTGATVQTAQALTALLGGAAIIPPATEYYDLADIILIKRLRTKKFMIKLAASANPLAD